MSDEFTPWFSATEQLPIRPGRYQVKCTHSTAFGRNGRLVDWDGTRWDNTWSRVRDCDVWRGLREKG